MTSSSVACVVVGAFFDMRMKKISFASINSDSQQVVNFCITTQHKLYWNTCFLNEMNRVTKVYERLAAVLFIATVAYDASDGGRICDRSTMQMTFTISGPPPPPAPPSLGVWQFWAKTMNSVAVAIWRTGRGLVSRYRRVICPTTKDYAICASTAPLHRAPVASRIRPRASAVPRLALSWSSPSSSGCWCACMRDHSAPPAPQRSLLSP